MNEISDAIRLRMLVGAFSSSYYSSELRAFLKRLAHGEKISREDKVLLKECDERGYFDGGSNII